MTTVVEISTVTYKIEVEGGPTLDVASDEIEAVVGGTQGPEGTFPLDRMKYGIAPEEEPDGSRTTFTVSGGYVVGTLRIYRSGERIFGFTADDGETFTLDVVPLVGEVLRCDLIAPPAL